MTWLKENPTAFTASELNNRSVPDEESKEWKVAA